MYLFRIYFVSNISFTFQTKDKTTMPPKYDIIGYNDKGTWIRLTTGNKSSRVESDVFVPEGTTKNEIDTMVTDMRHTMSIKGQLQKANREMELERLKEIRKQEKDVAKIVIGHHKTATKTGSDTKKSLLRIASSTTSANTYANMMALCEMRLTTIMNAHPASDAKKYDHSAIQKFVSNQPPNVVEEIKEVLQAAVATNPSPNVVDEIREVLREAAATNPFEYAQMVSQHIHRTIIDDIVTEYRMLSETSFGVPYLEVMGEKIFFKDVDSYCVVVFKLMEHFVAGDGASPVAVVHVVDVDPVETIERIVAKTSTIVMNKQVTL